MGSPLDRDDIEYMTNTMNPRAIIYTVSVVSLVFIWVIFINN